MKHFMIYSLLLIAATLTGHMATLYLVPEFIMDRTFKSMEARGITPHSFNLAPKATPESQTVVRPSPDLAYSICLFDFTDNPNPLHVTAAHRNGNPSSHKPSANGGSTGTNTAYASISFFDARTNNFATIRVQENNQGNNQENTRPGNDENNGENNDGNNGTGNRANNQAHNKNSNTTSTILLPPGAGPDMVLKGNSPLSVNAETVRIINSPTKRGIILIRRLAPGEDEYLRVKATAPLDQCQI